MSKINVADGWTPNGRQGATLRKFTLGIVKAVCLSPADIWAGMNIPKDVLLGREWTWMFA